MDHNVGDFPSPSFVFAERRFSQARDFQWPKSC